MPTAWRSAFGQRPVIFYSNGYEHWIWDDTRYPPRQIGGFYKRDELELADPAPHQPEEARRRKRSTARSSSAPISTAPSARSRKHFEQDGERKALLVMATGSGKTRTVIALVDLLMRAGWVKRVLFLADRIALVKQAAGAFKAHLPDSRPSISSPRSTSDGRVFLSTYPTMMNLIDGKQEGKARFGPGHFDLIVIDEAHRSVYQRYRAIFEYFDIVPRRTDRDAEGRDRPQHLLAVRPRGRRADRRLFARRGGAPTAISCRPRRSRCR